MPSRSMKMNISCLAAVALVALAAEASAGVDPGTDYFTLSPCRVHDTRTPVHDPLRGGPDRRRDIQVSGVCGVPAEAVAVAVNLTAVNASRAGSLFVYDADLADAPQPVSALELSAGRTRANNVIIGLSAGGKIAAELAADFTAADMAGLVVDVLGYFVESEPPGGIRIVKLTNGEDANVPPGPSIPSGATVVWQYIVTNTGSTGLSNIAVTDDQGVTVSCPKTSLQAGETMLCTGSGSAQGCQYSNIGNVTGTMPGGETVSGADPSHYFGTLQPGISIRKSTNGQDANTPPGPQIQVGSPVQWTYTVTNTGDSRLSNVRITDNMGVTVSCPKTSLASGESMICTGSGTAVAGQYSNLGTVRGTPPCGPEVTAEDPSHYFGNKPISMTKSTNGQNANTPPGPEIPVGSSVLWTYMVSNTGNSVLTNIRVTDDRGVSVSCPKTTLQIGESMTCVGSGTAAACQYSNIGTVTGTTQGGSEVTAQDPSHYFGTPCP